MTVDTQWLMFYRDEEELLQAVAEIDVHKFNELCRLDIVSGYQYITRASRAINAGDELSEPQMKLIKRMAKQVFKYHKYK